jgi:hypothetical protein
MISTSYLNPLNRARFFNFFLKPRSRSTAFLPNQRLAIDLDVPISSILNEYILINLFCTLVVFYLSCILLKDLAIFKH